MREVLVLGNPFFSGDSSALRAARSMETKARESGIEFRVLDSPEQIQGFGRSPVIMDAVKGLCEPRVFRGTGEFEEPKRVTAHDYDLMFELWLLKTTKKIDSFTIVGVPAVHREKNAEKALLLILGLYAHP